MRQRNGQSVPEFIRSIGAEVGTVLYGGPIMHNGRQIERPRQVRITAIGEQSVLAIGRIEGETRDWYESSWEFSSREWSISPTPNPSTGEAKGEDDNG